MCFLQTHLFSLLLLPVLLCGCFFPAEGNSAKIGRDPRNDDSSLRILFIAFIDSGSHITSMTPLIKKNFMLAEAGHRVTVFEASTRTTPRDLGANVSLHFIQVSKGAGVAAAMFRQFYRPKNQAALWDFNNRKFAEILQTHPEIFKELLEANFDVVVSDALFAVHSYALATFHRQFKATPYIIYSTSVLPQSHVYAAAMGRNWVTEPYPLTNPPLSRTDSYAAGVFYERLINLYLVASDIWFIGHWAEWMYLSNIEKVIGIRDFTFRKYYSEASAIVAESFDKGKYALTTGPEMFGIGVTCQRPKLLPRDLEQFVSDPASKGTIFIAFGTNDVAPDRVLDAFFGAIDRLRDYRVVFSYNGPERKTGKHVLLTKWAPQNDVLKHPRTLLFVSHGGLKSVKEALCAKLPVIFMPVYAEQAYNTKMALRFGYATTVNKFSVSKKNLLAAINEVLMNYAVYRKCAERASSLLFDRPPGVSTTPDALRLARFAVERTARWSQSGTNDWVLEHFRRRGQDLSTPSFIFAEYVFGIAAFVWVLATKGAKKTPN